MRKLLLTSIIGLILINSCSNRDVEITESSVNSQSAIAQTIRTLNTNDDILAL